MRSSSKVAVRIAILIGLAIATFIIGWPMAVLFVWLNETVSWSWIALAALIVVLMAAVVEEVTDDENR